MKTYITSLGCPKNLVDTEASVSYLEGAGCSVTNNPSDADLLIVSACSFLDLAWRETVEEVERLAEVKERGSGKKLIVMGCLPKHRGLDLVAELPLVDHFLPTGTYDRLPNLVKEWRQENVVTRLGSSDEVNRFAGLEERTLLTPQHTAYIKIAEGCSRRCSFCAIPKIRGKMVSRDADSIVREVEHRMAQGVKEVSLLAQDITSYNANGVRFPELVDRIAATGVEWIRIFYVHPGSLTVDLARRLFRYPNVCRYLESPVQHGSDRVLKRMRRPYTGERLGRLFAGIQREFPDVKIRSEVIVGFPGEDDADFDTLKLFIERARFSSLGVFRYSPESNTPAAMLDGMVDAATMEERAAEIEDIQRSVALGIHHDEVGRVHRILVDRQSTDAGESENRFVGRFYGQALDVDGEVRLLGRNPVVGEFVNAVIVDGDGHDMSAKVI